MPEDSPSTTENLKVMVLNFSRTTTFGFLLYDLLIRKVVRGLELNVEEYVNEKVDIVSLLILTVSCIRITQVYWTFHMMSSVYGKHNKQFRRVRRWDSLLT